MSCRLEFDVVESWPRLAWVARMVAGNERVLVTCGQGVELADDRFFEAVWDGPFAAGDFDRTDIVAGSGGRLRSDKLTFVSSSSMQDRLHHIQHDSAVFLSNSMSALASVIDASVDPANDKYDRIFGTIYGGLDEYERKFPTSRGAINFRYYENLEWNGQELIEVRKPRIQRDFSTYESYIGFLQATMAAVVENAGSGQRHTRYDPLVTISSGYDGPTVAAIAASAGVNRGITLAVDRDGVNDSGEEIGKILGYDMTVYGRECWQHLDMPEIDGIAASANSAEVSFAGMQEHLENGLLFSGFWGGLIWRKLQDDLRPTFHGNDGAGVSWSEMRLTTGFINCPLPYWGGLQLADVVKLSNSPEMEPWSIGGWYDRPISRRLLENLQVPRGAFGQKKQGVSEHVLGARRFLTTKSADDYEAWLRENRKSWYRSGKLPPSIIAGKSIDWLVLNVMGPLFRRLVFPVLRRLSMLPGLAFVDKWHIALRKYLKKQTYFPLRYRRFTYAWAFERAKDKYRKRTS